MQGITLKNLLMMLVTFVGLTFGGIAMAGDGDKSDDTGSGDSYQVPQAGGDSGSDSGSDSNDDSDW